MTPDEAESGSDRDAATEHDRELRRIVARKSRRRERARGEPDSDVLRWMSTFGMVGWSVSLPTLLGLALGVFVDNRVDSSISFTITFLIAGVAVGSLIAWYWVRRESEARR